ncbi:hypothetical protein TNCT_236771 [Trichonephila clavata]|uniref:RING-type domain-containing protein n=1 Tax=Trichonephila clavata TaxID=2740835 RepID=A0A8X6M7B1_TRICU|nr:hypothetical protein TNCT_236771 [Trichonephila clavata]
MTKKGAKRKRNVEKQPNKVKKIRSRANILEEVRILTHEEEAALECCICRDTQNFEKMKFLICGHKFHEFCIDKWFMSTPGAPTLCPLCRTDQIRESLYLLEDSPNLSLPTIHNK